MPALAADPVLKSGMKVGTLGGSLLAGSRASTCCEWRRGTCRRRECGISKAAPKDRPFWASGVLQIAIRGTGATMKGLVSARSGCSV
jgi:hypothetical protein